MKKDNSTNAAVQRSDIAQSVQPPPYSPTVLSLQRNRPSEEQTNIPGLPALKFNAYRLPDSTISDDRSTITTTYAPFCTSIGALMPFLKEQSLLPPKPEIRIVGQHKGVRGAPEDDFNIRLDMMPYLLPADGESPPPHLYISDSYRPSMNSVEAIEALRREAAAFWNTNQRAKSFTLNRTIINWDTEYIEGRIRSLLSELGYRGKTTITFPFVYSTVVVRPAKTFVDIFSVFAEHQKFSVDIAWPFANVRRGQTDNGIWRQCNVCDEELWWNTWKSTIREAALSNHKGWIGTEAWLELAMSNQQRSRKPTPWGLDAC